MVPSRPKSLRNLALIASPLVLFFAVLVLALLKVRVFFFGSLSLVHYVVFMWAVPSAIIAFVSAVGPTARLIKTIATGQVQEPQEVTGDRLIVTWRKAIIDLFQRKTVSLSTTVVLLIAGIGILLIEPTRRSPRTSSSVLAVTEGTQNIIYVADAENGRLLIFRSSNLATPPKTIDIGTHGNIAGSGRPEQMIELRRFYKLQRQHLIFVTDTAYDKIHVINVNTNDEVGLGFSSGRAPRSLAITQDGLKLYISNEQPSPNGTISVCDLGSENPADFHCGSVVKGKINCPEGLALSPDGKYLYVATQCGGGKDPVLVIDTVTDEVIIPRAIPDLAVGTSVVSGSNDHHIYVGRGNFPCARPDPKESGSPVTVVNLQNPAPEKRNTICLRTSVGVMAMSRDENERYLFVANGNYLTVLHRENFSHGALPNDVILNDIPLEAGVGGISVSDDDNDRNSVYAFLPGSRRIFVYSPAGL